MTRTFDPLGNEVAGVSISKVPTGISGLDEVLGGGCRKGVPR
ncbi:MAG: hypothetical protein AB7G75_07955 [Candidatus Binatia bacterium]